MHFSNDIEDENYDNNLHLLPPNYRFQQMPGSIRPTHPLPRLTPMPKPPLLAMQLMMLRVKNSTSSIHQRRQLSPRATIGRT